MRAEPPSFRNVSRRTTRQSLAIAASALQAGELTRAEQAFLQIARQDPSSGEARFFLGVIAQQRQDVETAILQAAGPGPFRRLVDLGSGTGRMLTLLGPRAETALGLDLSQQMLNIARDHVALAGLPGCELRHGDIFDVLVTASRNLLETDSFGYRVAAGEQSASKRVEASLYSPVLRSNKRANMAPRIRSSTSRWTAQK